MLEHLYFPHDISTFGPTIDLLFEVIFWVVMVTWIAVTVAMVVFLVRYRHRPGRKAEYIEGNSRLEVFWTTATAVILVALAFASRSTWADIKENGPPGDVFYKVDGKAIQLGNHVSGSGRQTGHRRRRDGRERLSRAGEQGGASGSRPQRM